MDDTGRNGNQSIKETLVNILRQEIQFMRLDYVAPFAQKHINKLYSNVIFLTRWLAL